MPRRKPPRKAPSVEPSAGGALKIEKPLRVLLVDREDQPRRVLAQVMAEMPMTVIQARSAAEARSQLEQYHVDLALIDPDLPDGSGLELAGEIKRNRPITQTILITAQPSIEGLLAGFRSGAADMIRKPLEPADLTERVRQAVHRLKIDTERHRRLGRLRRVCKKLNAARQEVTQQVDILCNDLVTAYQELAAQVQQAVQTGEFTALLKQELDLEQVLRKTLEYLLTKAGPTNAAVFLPSNADEYALGGYVNYDCAKDSADLLLQHLADVVAPKMNQRTEPLHVTDNKTLNDWIGADAAYLADSHVLAFNCAHDGESLAVVVLFRDGGQPFDASLVETCAAIGPMLGDYLAKVIRIHHRHIPGFGKADA